MRRLARLSPLVFLVAACSGGRDHPPPTTVVADAAPRRPAVRPGKVHAYPPHAIRSDGVGPYLLGEQMIQVLRELPEGPHLELLQVGGYANWRLTRAEGGAIVIGADDTNEVIFVSVLRPEVARTSGGIEVGTPQPGLRLADSGVIRDRVVLELPGLPGVSFLSDAPVGTDPGAAAIVGVVVARRPAPRSELDAGTGCPGLAAPTEEILAVAKLRQPPEHPLLRFGCVSGASPEVIVIGGGEVILVGGEAGKLKRIAAAGVGDVNFAGALDLDGDHRDEIVLGAQRHTPREHAVEVRVLRFDAGKLVEVLAERPFSISAEAAAAAGVTPEQIDVAVEIRAGKGGLLVGGFYTVRREGALRELTPLPAAVLRLDTRKVPGPIVPAGAADAAPPTDAAR